MRRNIPEREKLNDSLFLGAAISERVVYSRVFRPPTAHRLTYKFPRPISTISTRRRSPLKVALRDIAGRKPRADSAGSTGDPNREDRHRLLLFREVSPRTGSFLHRAESPRFVIPERSVSSRAPRRHIVLFPFLSQCDKLQLPMRQMCNKFPVGDNAGVYRGERKVGRGIIGRVSHVLRLKVGNAWRSECPGVYSVSKCPVDRRKERAR